VSLDDKYLYFSNWIRGGNAVAIIAPCIATALICCCVALPHAASHTAVPELDFVCADINQYDISDPEKPKHVGRVWVGGSIRKGSGVTVTEGMMTATAVPCHVRMAHLPDCAVN
jgi:56kDa selenium binding protein (SBP56)